MKHHIAFCSVFFGLTLVGMARTDEPIANLPAVVEDMAAELDAKKDKPKPPDKEKKPIDVPKTDIFSDTALMGSQFPTGFNPQMMGDFQGGFARRTILVMGTQTITTTTTTTIMNGSQKKIVTTTTTIKIPKPEFRTILVPIFSSGAFKIAENTSPRPLDRVFFTYNYFNNLNGPGNQADPGLNATDTTKAKLGPNATTVKTDTFFPPMPRFNANLHREVFGFEKTFLDGNASIELRVPIGQQQTNIDGFNFSNVGDLTIFGKYALLNDRDTGNVFTLGFAVTAPTGPSTPTIDGSLHATLLQPWFGYIWNAERFFVHGFHSVVAPTDARDVTLLFNDVGVSYWLYRAGPERRITSVVPTAEVHITTPVTHRDMNGPAFVPDLVVLTGGLHVGFLRNFTLSLGIAVPVTGPRIFSAEYSLQFNRRF
ncbi:MAG: hypothetical protein HYR84_03310 [Planctomycetes bacterium]|nr:hypothetical protein [Planctomycetota bacterium]